MKINITVELIPEVKEEMVPAKVCTNKMAAVGIGRQINQIFESVLFGTGVRKVETTVNIQRNIKFIPTNQR